MYFSCPAYAYAIVTGLAAAVDAAPKPCAFLPFNLVVLSSLLFLGSLEDLLALVKTVGIWSLLYFVTSRSIKKMKGGISDKKQGLKVA